MPAEKRWIGHLASHRQHRSHYRNLSRGHGCSDERASHVDGEATTEGGETDMVKIAETVLDMPVRSRLLHLRGRQRMGKTLHPGIADVERQRRLTAQDTTHFMLSLQASRGWRDPARQRALRTTLPGHLSGIKAQADGFNDR
jgi:hypothetical protein